MVKRSKSQANLIPIVSLILLVIAGSVVVFTLYNSFIKESAQQIKVPFTYYRGDVGYSLIDSNSTIVLNVARSFGSGNILGVKFFFKFNDGSISTYTNMAILNESEIKKYAVPVKDITPPLDNFSSLKSVSVHYIYPSSKGELIVTPYEIASSNVPNKPGSSGTGVKCYDECSLNVCNGNYSFTRCIINSNGCNTWGSNSNCGVGERCVNGSCVHIIYNPAFPGTIINTTNGSPGIFNMSFPIGNVTLNGTGGLNNISGGLSLPH